jgi:hypothetical protein
VATAKGKRMVQKLSESIEAHYASMEDALGKPQLAQLYALLDAVIATDVTHNTCQEGAA